MEIGPHLVDHRRLPTSQCHRLRRRRVAPPVAAGARPDAIGAGLDQTLRLPDRGRGTGQDLHQGVGGFQLRNPLLISRRWGNTKKKRYQE
jgi:hypothetical protein